MESGEDIVFCCSFENDVTAHIAQSILEDNAIVSIIDNQIFASLLPIGFNSIGDLRLMVYRKDLEQARSIIRDTGLSVYFPDK